MDRPCDSKRRDGGECALQRTRKCSREDAKVQAWPQKFEWTGVILGLTARSAAFNLPVGGSNLISSIYCVCIYGIYGIHCMYGINIRTLTNGI